MKKRSVLQQWRDLSTLGKIVNVFIFAWCWWAIPLLFLGVFTLGSKPKGTTTPKEGQT